MIKGITDRQKIMLPRIAKIRLGIRASGRGYPTDVDYFVLTDCPDVAEKYGQKPKKLVAMFASDDTEINFRTRAEAWKSSGQKIAGTDKPRSILYCHSQGQGTVATRIYRGKEKDPQGHAVVAEMDPEQRPEIGEMFQLECPLEACPLYESRECKPTGRLNFFLPQVTWRGLYQIETSSLFAFGNVQQFFNLLKFLNKGRIAGIPFIISRQPQSMNVGGKSVVKHIIHLEISDQIPEMLPPPFLQEGRQLTPVEQDRPEDLFPPAVTAAPEEQKVLPEKADGKDNLDVLAEMADISPAQLEGMKIALGGDIGKIKHALEEKIKDKDINDCFPDSKQAEAPSGGGEAAAGSAQSNFWESF